jgi:transposase
MIQLIWATMGYKPTILLADAGYFSYDNIDLLNQIGTDSYIPDNFFRIEERGKSKYFPKSMFRFNKENEKMIVIIALLVSLCRLKGFENEMMNQN